jgi:hypothetical protein
VFGKLFKKRQPARIALSSDAMASGSEDSPIIEISLERIGGARELEWSLIEVSETEIRQALDGWTWIGLDGLTVVAISAFGDIFLRSPDRAIHMLDTLEGKLKRVAASLANFAAQLQEPTIRDDWLLSGLVNAAQTRGMLLEPGECYDFRVAPVIGGKMDLDSMHKLSFVVKVHLAGQLHQQVKDLPPGTRISGFTIADPE